MGSFWTGWIGMWGNLRPAMDNAGGGMGCEVWMSKIPYDSGTSGKLGGPPWTDLSECQFLATDSRTPYAANFDGSEANQTAHFFGRWMSTRNEPGPLSETVSATVPG